MKRSIHGFVFLERVGLVTLLALLLAAQSAHAEPIRVATLLPFVEEALELLPEEARVVASVRRELHSPLAAGLIDLGNPHSPNFERLAEARPQILVGDASIHAALAPRLGAVGAELRLIETSSVAATLDSLDELARSLGESRALLDRTAALRTEIATLRIEEPISILPLFGAPGSFYAVTSRAWLGDLVSRLGFENLAPTLGDSRFPGLVQVSDEILTSLQPDLVVLVTHGNPDQILADLKRRTEGGGPWSSLGRARLGLHVLDPKLYAANPGLGLERAARGLVALGTEQRAGGAGMTLVESGP